MKNIFSLYRFLTVKKVSSMRLMLYVILGLIISKENNILLLLCNLLFVFGGILFASLLNDYYDYKLQGENNSVGQMIKNQELCESRIKYYIWIPCIIPLILFIPMVKLGASYTSMSLLTISFILSLCYCTPPMRFKERPFIGIITPPIGIYLLFLQALLINDQSNSHQLFIAVLLFIYTWYLDFIHLANDSVEENEVIKISGKNAIEAAKYSAVIGILFSITIFPLYYIALIPLLFWSVRLYKMWNININNIATMRGTIFSRIYCIEEFAFYILIVLTQ